jgi:hypothetical protein
MNPANAAKDILVEVRLQHGPSDGFGILVCSNTRSTRDFQERACDCPVGGGHGSTKWKHRGIGALFTSARLCSWHAVQHLMHGARWARRAVMLS